MKRLPDEVLSNIFSHIDAVDLAKIEIVSKQWKKVIRSNQSLWKNINYTNRPDFEIKKINKVNNQLIKLLSRGDGNFNSLNIHIPNKFYENEAIKMFCNILPHTNVKHLSIFLWTNVKSTYTVRNVNKIPTYLLRNLTALIVQAVQDCGSLETLSLKTEIDGLRIRAFADSTSPMAKCRLKKLYLQGFDLSFFFGYGNDAFYEMLSEVKTIEMKKCKGLTSEIIAKLLKASKNTVETFGYDKIMDKDETEEGIVSGPIISMPNLKNLQLQVTYPRSLGVKLRCHSLHHVEVVLDTVGSLFENSNKPRNEILVLEGKHQERSLNDIISDIAFCKNLRRLELRNYPSNPFKAIQKSIEGSSINEVVVQDRYMEEYETDIINLVRFCQQDPSTKKLELLHLKHCMQNGPPTDPLAEDILAWLEKNVNDFKYEHVTS